METQLNQLTVFKNSVFGKKIISSCNTKDCQKMNTKCAISLVNNLRGVTGTFSPLTL